MTAFNATPLSYDLNGNLISDGTNTYTWDARNHLVALVGSGPSGTTASFVYDAMGRRAGKTVNGQISDFLYDGWNPVQELTPVPLGGFLPTANMLTDLGIDEFFQRQDANGALSFISDAFESTLALTNSLGSITTSYTYEPFGNVSISPSGINSNPYQFTGHDNDNTGLNYHRARYYSPIFQRFLSQDPIGFAGGNANLYGPPKSEPARERRTAARPSVRALCHRSWFSGATGFSSPFVYGFTYKLGGSFVLDTASEGYSIRA